jgi:hypothetical protein
MSVNIHQNYIYSAPVVSIYTLSPSLKRFHRNPQHNSCAQPRLSYEDLRIFTVPIVEGMDGEEEDKMSTTTGSSDTGRDQDSVGGEKGAEGGDDTSEAGADGDDKAETAADADADENEYDDDKEEEEGGEGDSKEAATVEVESELEQSGQLFKSHCHSPCGKELDQELGSEILKQDSTLPITATENNGNNTENVFESETLDGENKKAQEKRKNVLKDLSSPILNKNSGRLEVLDSKTSINESEKNKESVVNTTLSPQLMAKLTPNKLKEKGIDGEKEEETDLLDTTRTDRECIENTPRENLIMSFASLSLKSTGKSDILNSLSKSLDHCMEPSESFPSVAAESNSRISSRRNSATSSEKIIL